MGIASTTSAKKQLGKSKYLKGNTSKNNSLLKRLFQDFIEAKEYELAFCILSSKRN